MRAHQAGGQWEYTAGGRVAKSLRFWLVVALLVLTWAGLAWKLRFRLAQSLQERHRYTERRELQARMKADPGQPWPRGVGHVLLAWPGSREMRKGYLEPGGSFSPAVGSFGILIQSGACTSSTVPLDQIQQWMDTGLGVTTETSCYTADWSVESPASFLLNVKSKGDRPLTLLLRSDGPAGGPLSSITWDNDAILVNHAWRIEPADGASQPLAPPRVSGSGDWLQASIPVNSPSLLRVRSLSPAEESPVFPEALGLKALNSLPVVDVPDKRFSDSLNAQERHLLMGLVRDETRPGDPVNYPLAWLRDGAYGVTGLARAGQIDAAKTLALYFARHDFFGGFGAEGDMPGFALWTMNETAERAADSKFDAAIWPDAYRKAEIIVELLHARHACHALADGPIVPMYLRSNELTLVADPARDGLIQGRMDWARPVLFVNGMDYAGLRAAARMARRQPGEVAALAAQRWDKEADALQAAWEKGLQVPANRQQYRSALAGFWPSHVADRDAERYVEYLSELWNKGHDAAGNPKDPILWSYFEVAVAHQWLLAARADAPGALEHLWQTLNWFWSHQTSPGLYTWSEGSGEENTFGLWENVRGWVNPPYVTPHYWTAGEMLNLQLDMLVHEDPDGKLTIGLGVPDAWLSHPMRVDGILCPGGRISWTWDGKRLQVLRNGKPAEFIAGPAFRKAAGH